VTIRDNLTDYLQPEVAADLAWQRQAACLGRWAEVNFYPDRGQSAAAAKKVCCGCAVRSECLTDALVRHERLGVHGGTTEKERRPLLRRVGRGESVSTVVASVLPRVRLGWRPANPTSQRYGEWLLSRRGTAA
jgi:WhiB family transcriptional regulator, redox-sensing transcriptional regulator